MSVDEEDVALLDALHINPRASFEQLGPVLGASPVTIARRWRRLRESGRAWVSAAPGPRLPLSGALLWAECEPGRAVEAGQALAAWPQVFSVHLTTAGLYALVAAADNAALSALLIDHLPTAPGLARVRNAVISEMYSGVHWRLGAISEDQATRVRPDTTGGGRLRTLDAFERQVFLALQDDGRATYRDLAERLGRSEQAIRRRISALARDGLMTFRTDFARPEGGWHVQTALWLTLHGHDSAEAGAELGGWKQTRVCAAIIDTAQLFLTFQLHQICELDTLTRQIHARWPGAEILDRQVILRPVKSWGRLLDPTGYATTTIPVDPWAPIPDTRG